MTLKIILNATINKYPKKTKSILNSISISFLNKTMIKDISTKDIKRFPIILQPLSKIFLSFHNLGLYTYEAPLNINYKNSEGDEYLASKFRENNIDDSVYVDYLTKKDLLANSAGFGTMISYLAIYIGSVFLIASAAVLALQQLSEAADNIDRYALLRKIGVDEEMINRSILVQIAIYFMIPLSLAIVHSILGLKISSDIVSVFGDGSIMNYIIVTMIIMIIIYGGYFIAAYNGAKKMLKYC